MATRVRMPIWVRLVALLLAAWFFVGCAMCYLQLKLGADAMPDATQYDRALYAGLPGWYDICYAIGVLAGLIGAVMLLFRSRWTVAALSLSLAAAIIQFLFLFADTDVIAHKGASIVLPLPIVIVLIGAGALWLASRARQRGWLRQNPWIR